ncbi:SigE family RNA polymerase sigma factor [Catellatospora sp. NPDC049609]|uniref:SigE family RNA polymerase sigma factor n=1 Tax=Catellatospora sp. NPDC049609 TaxID=3155505 RepID=UPI00343A30B1
MNKFDGFHEFVVARGGALSRTAYLLTGEHHAAEDLVQSALAKAAVRWRQIVANGHPEAYIKRTMINEHISWWRRRPARPMAELPELPGPDEPRQVVDRVVLGRALDTLTAKQRAVVVLRYYEDLSEADTAAAMGCSVGTVKSQTHLALGKLRSALPMFAEQAGVYADAEAALTRARTSRSRRIAVGAAVLVLPVVLVAALFAVRGGDAVPPPLTGTPSPSPSASVPYPPVPTQVPGSAAVAELPADRGVGRASLLRHDNTTEPGKARLDVLVDGSWYRLTVPDAWIFPPGSHASAAVRAAYPAALSPNGRWLTWIGPGDDGRITAFARDLTGTTTWTMPGAQVVRWSPAGEWLIGYDTWNSRHLRMSVVDGTLVAVMRRDKKTAVAGVLDSGELLRVRTGGGDDAVLLEVVEPRTDAVRPLTVDLAGWRRAGEQAEKSLLAYSFIHPGADGVAAIELRDETGQHTRAYLEFSLADGRVLRRHDLPASAAPIGSTFVLCLRGPQLVWRGADAFHVRQEPGGADTAVALPPGRYRLPGCGTLL